MISKPLVRRTLATLRNAEFGFFGVVVYTRVHTPRRCGLFCIAGDLDFVVSAWRPWRTSWLMVGMVVTCSRLKSLGFRSAEAPMGTGSMPVGTGEPVDKARRG